jgi:hypothetical protein
MCSSAAKIYWQKREPKPAAKSLTHEISNKEHIMRGVLLWLVGIPIPIIILLYLFNVV